jgi:NAD(P)-dependent dehydrogenase (short-subunit alcohol dehydrogenase family)
MSSRRVCLFTGAGGRLGNDFCQRFAADYDIVAVCRNHLPEVADQDRGFIDPLDVSNPRFDEPEVFTVKADLRDDGAVNRVVELALARFGRIDVLVNAAAHVQHERLTTLAGDTGSLDAAFQVNATLPIKLAATVARMYWDGRINENLAHNRNVINISSGAGLGFVHQPGLGAYSASKVALNFLTCYLAEEFRGFGLRVNAIAPTTFPDLLPTAEVSKEISRLDGALESGEIIEMV